MRLLLGVILASIARLLAAAPTTADGKNASKTEAAVTKEYVTVSGDKDAATTTKIASQSLFSVQVTASPAIVEATTETTSRPFSETPPPSQAKTAAEFDKTISEASPSSEGTPVADFATTSRPITVAPSTSEVKMAADLATRNEPHNEASPTSEGATVADFATTSRPNTVAPSTSKVKTAADFATTNEPITKAPITSEDKTSADFATTSRPITEAPRNSELTTAAPITEAAERKDTSKDGEKAADGQKANEEPQKAYAEEKKESKQEEEGVEKSPDNRNTESEDKSKGGEKAADAQMEGEEAKKPGAEKKKESKQEEEEIKKSTDNANTESEEKSKDGKKAADAQMEGEEAKKPGAEEKTENKQEEETPTTTKLTTTAAATATAAKKTMSTTNATISPKTTKNDGEAIGVDGTTTPATNLVTTTTTKSTVEAITTAAAVSGESQEDKEKREDQENQDKRKENRGDEEDKGKEDAEAESKPMSTSRPFLAAAEVATTTNPVREEAREDQKNDQSEVAPPTEPVRDYGGEDGVKGVASTTQRVRENGREDEKEGFDGGYDKAPWQKEDERMPGVPAEEYRPCAGERDGATCTLCAPGDEECVENTAVKKCYLGKCQRFSEYKPCAGKRNGLRCKRCAPWDKDCVETSELKVCLAGQCRVLPKVCPDGWTQLGKRGDEVPGWGLVPVTNTATSREDCAEQCNELPKCGSFEYTVSSSKCGLNSWEKSTREAQRSSWGRAVTCKKAMRPDRDECKLECDACQVDRAKAECGHFLQGDTTDYKVAAFKKCADNLGCGPCLDCREEMRAQKTATRAQWPGKRSTTGRPMGPASAMKPVLFAASKKSVGGAVENVEPDPADEGTSFMSLFFGVMFLGVGAMLAYNFLVRLRNFLERSSGRSDPYKQVEMGRNSYMPPSLTFGRSDGL